MGSDQKNNIFKISDLGEVITGKTPPTEEKDNFGNFIPFVTPGDLQNGKYVQNSDRYLSKKGLEIVKNNYLPAGSIMVSCIGTVGEVGVAGRDCVTNQQINSIIPSEKVFGDYLYYKLIQMKEELQIAASGGSVVPIINKTDFSNMEISLPPLNTQVRVASILSALDDKIELNRQMNRTLEAMARAIFKSWFVDFDPVYAKMEGRDYPLPAEVMDLFPDELVESELGLIPKGWKVVELKDIVQRHNAPQRYRKSDVLDFGNVPVYEQGNSILMGFHNNKADFESSLSEPMFIFGDHTCVMKLIITPFSIGPNVIPMSGKKVPTIWSYYSSLGKQNFEEYRRHWMEFKIKKAVLPDKFSLLSSFVEVISSIIQRKTKNEQEIEILVRLRDVLLPKLMSGKVEV